ncbi:MAG: alpha-glucosidase/alpha-galactosidase, partial [Lachnospiraceae bacterium]|nr:alpha-glucosidase/alpha-galactosidase [Lachnospiraceae bacterium]
LAERIADSIEMAEGRKSFPVVKSNEEAVDLMKALLGFQKKVSNVNMPNRGQMPQMPLGSIVETNCIFSNDQVKPVVSKPLPIAVANLVYRNCVNIDTTYEGIKERDLKKIYLAFANQPLCNTLSMEQSKELFKEMCLNTREYLDEFFPIDKYFD